MIGKLLVYIRSSRLKFGVYKLTNCRDSELRMLFLLQVNPENDVLSGEFNVTTSNDRRRILCPIITVQLYLLSILPAKCGFSGKCRVYLMYL